MNPGLFDLRDWRWPNFTPEEIRCSHCSELVLDPEAMDKLQRAREEFRRPVRVASGYRCPLHPIEKAKPAPGPHTSGAAFDVYPHDMTLFNQWFQALAHQGLFRFGFSPGIFTLHTGRFHVDWDRSRQPAVWYYA